MALIEWLNKVRLQVSLSHHGGEALKGEYESTLAIHKIQGEFAPKPVAHGSFTKTPDTHYYICKFYKLVEELSEPSKFRKRVAALHSDSTSPNDKLGFHIVTTTAICRKRMAIQILGKIALLMVSTAWLS